MGSACGRRRNGWPSWPRDASAFESSPVASDRLELVTAGIGAFLLKVEGRASHAGAAPEQGRNALYEL